MRQGGHELGPSKFQERPCGVSRMHDNLRTGPRWGSIQRSTDPVLRSLRPRGEGPAVLSPVTRNRKLGPSEHDGLDPCMFWGERAMPANWHLHNARKHFGGLRSALDPPIADILSLNAAVVKLF